jgi:DNA-directed RNA polymerase specialized sigma subunit
MTKQQEQKIKQLLKKAIVNLEEIQENYKISPSEVSRAYYHLEQFQLQLENS